MFLVFGILATGATRQNVYSGAKCIMGGRVSALFVSLPNHDTLLQCRYIFVRLSFAFLVPCSLVHNEFHMDLHVCSRVDARHYFRHALVCVF